MLKSMINPDSSGKKTIILTVLAVLVSSLAFAQYGAHPMYEKMERGPHKMGLKRNQEHHQLGALWNLDLTVDQKDLIHEYLNAFAKKKINITSDIKVLALEKREMLKDQNFDSAKDEVSDIYKKKAVLQKGRIDLKEQIWNVLTKEQQDQLVDQCYFMDKSEFSKPLPPHGKPGKYQMRNW